MKLLAAVISSALAAREPDAERRLEKITARATELNAFVQAYDRSSQKQKNNVNKYVTRLLSDLNAIDTSKCPLPVEEDKFADEIDTIEDLCDGAGKVPSMMRSYARKFGCAEGFPKRKFLEKVIRRSHKLKRVANRAGKCNKEPEPTDPPVTDPPITDAPATGLCNENQHAVCSDLTDAEIFFENEWTCRNCFRIRAYYGTSGGFSFDPRTEFVKIVFTDKVYFTGVWSHPLTNAGPIIDENTWKLTFKPDGNFVSGMMFDAELRTVDNDLWVDGQWIIDGAQSCKCKGGPPPKPDEPCDDPCNGRENCETFIDSCAVVPERDNTIANTTASAGYRVSADVKCGAVPDDWAAIAHINTGSRWDVLGDRYFALFASPEGQGEGSLKFNGPLKGGDKDMITVWPDCVDGEWATYTVEQTYVDQHELDLTLSVNGEVLATEKVAVEDAYTGALNVDVAGDWHDAATGFKIKNFFHQTYDAPTCEPEDPCAGVDNCDTLVDSCSIVPKYNTQIGTVDGDAIYSASVDVLCRKSEDHSWQSVVHMTQGGYRENFGDRYFTIWQRADGKLKINAPLKGNTDFDEVEYFVSCEDNSWTNIAVEQVAIEGDLLDLSVFQDGNKLGSNQLHYTNAFTGPIDVYAGNSWFDPASFFRIKNFIHSSRAYVAPECDGSDPCEDLENCETYVDSCGIAPYRGNRLAETSGTLGFRISADVRCTDRIAPSWENVLHVHTGTNRENFGDRYFTIWKQADATDGIRIVAPLKDNPQYELNAYVSCSPGWHTFTVQQTESGRANMLVEILMDGVVVESQEVQKDDTYQGALFVEASNEFAWPAAYDHLVRNFYHQDITCMDPCLGDGVSENCQTLIDSCAETPVKRNKIGSISATVNYETSLDILCTDEMPIGDWLSIIHMTTGNSAQLGDRFFMITRKNDEDVLMINIADSNKEDGNTGKFLSECTPGEWNTYNLSVRQNPDWPSHTYSTVTVDNVEVLQIRQDTDTVLPADTTVDVYFSDKYMNAADAFQVRNFFHQTFDDLPYDPETVMDCTEEAVCNILGEDDVRFAYKNHHVATVTAAVNYRISLDILCDAMPVGEWYNMVHMQEAESGEGRFFYVSQRNSDADQLLVEASDPTRDSGFAGRWTNCPAGEWTTISIVNRQDSSDPTVTTLKFYNGDNLLHEQSAPTANFMSGEELKVFISSPHSKNSETHQLKNFVYERFEDACKDPCAGLDNCQTFFDSCAAATPVKGNKIGSISATVNYEISVDILCTDEMPIEDWFNIIHMKHDGDAATLGDRFFMITRKKNDATLMINRADSNKANGRTGVYFRCTPGEWNTYKVSSRQHPDWPSHTYSTVTVDNVEVGTVPVFKQNTETVLANKIIDVFFSDDHMESADAFQVRNFFHQSFEDIPYEPDTVMDCREESVCNILGEDDARFAYNDHHVATVTAAVNYRISVDILCNAMPAGVWYNIVHMQEAESGQDRFFYIAQNKNNPDELSVQASDPTRDSGSHARGTTCPPGEWITISVENAQDSSDPSVTTLKFKSGDDVLYEQSAPTEDFMSGNELNVYISSPSGTVSETHKLKNFVYERFEDVPAGPLNCENDDFCTIVGPDAVYPSTGNLAATITAANNFKFSIDIQCTHEMDFGEYLNIFHVTTGPDDGEWGARYFAFWRKRNSNEFHMTWPNPLEAVVGHSRSYYSCNDGEWNTYTLTKSQVGANADIVRYTLAIDGVTVQRGSKTFDQNNVSRPVHPFLNGEVLQVWLSKSLAATAFKVRNFTYEKFADL